MKKILLLSCVLVLITFGCQKSEEKKQGSPPEAAKEVPSAVASSEAPSPPAPQPQDAPSGVKPEARKAPDKKAGETKPTQEQKPAAQKEQAPAGEKSMEAPGTGKAVSPAKQAKTPAESGSDPGQKLAKLTPPADVSQKDYLKARPFMLSDIHGNVFNLSDFKGKVVAIEFSASWCPPCMKSAQNMRAIYDRFRERGFNMCLVMIDGQKDLEKSANMVKKLGIPYSVLLDEGGKVSQDYEVKAIPTFLLIDKQGRIVSRKMGLKAEEEITKDIESQF